MNKLGEIYQEDPELHNHGSRFLAGRGWGLCLVGVGSVSSIMVMSKIGPGTYCPGVGRIGPGRCAGQRFPAIMVSGSKPSNGQ